MNRKKGPALYELISSKQPVQKPDMSTTTEVRYDDDDNLEHNVLTPGRSVRMSVGTIGVVIAVCIALIVISYTMGFRRGSAIAREDYGNRLFEELPATTMSENRTNLNPIVATGTIQQTTPTRWGAIQSDPRVTGYYYYTLIETSLEGATQLATFCRERGLETYVVSRNNTGFHRVIALPGSANRNDAKAVELRSTIDSVGSQWASTRAGSGERLQDAYQILY